LVSFNTTSGTTYIFKIIPQSGTSGAYTLAVTAPTANIRTNSIPVTVGYSSSHTIYSSGQHWFSFQGTGNSIVFETQGNVVTTNMLFYVGSSGSSILTDKSRISFSTVTGTTYYIQITGNSGTYTFSLRNGTGDGSSRSYAIPVTVGYSASHTISYSGEHWFSFYGTGNPVIFETTGNVVDTYIEFYAGYYGWSGSGGAGSNARVSFTTTLGTTYIFKIIPQSGTSGAYTLVVQ
jgi:hypothetical protein